MTNVCQRVDYDTSFSLFFYLFRFVWWRRWEKVKFTFLPSLSSRYKTCGRMNPHNSSSFWEIVSERVELLEQLEQCWVSERKLWSVFAVKLTILSLFFSPLFFPVCATHELFGFFLSFSFSVFWVKKLKESKDTVREERMDGYMGWEGGDGKKGRRRKK